MVHYQVFSKVVVNVIGSAIELTTDTASGYSHPHVTVDGTVGVVTYTDLVPPYQAYVTQFSLGTISNGILFPICAYM